jgi:hypothetical protein
LIEQAAALNDDEITLLGARALIGTSMISWDDSEESGPKLLRIEGPYP